MTTFQNRLTFAALLSVVALLCIDPALAQSTGGLDRVNTFMDNILALLRGISITVATIAIIWAGYKFLYQHADLSEVVYIVGGGLLVGAAAEIARYLIGSGP